MSTQFFLRLPLMLKAAVAVVLLAGTCSTATASVTTFTDESSWVAALTGAPTTDDYDGLSPSSTTLSSVDRTNHTISGTLFVGGVSSDPWIGVTSTDATFNLKGPTPGAVTAVAFKAYVASNSSGSAGSGKITFSIAGQGFTFEEPAFSSTSDRFFGFISTTAFSSFSVSGSLDGQTGGVVVLDDFSFGTASTPAAVPEPASLSLLGVLAAVGVGRKVVARRKRKASEGGAVTG